MATRISLIGPGDIEFHYKEFLGLGESALKSHLKGIAQSLANSNVEIELLPDRGVSIEIAKLYKQKNGRRVIGAVPKSDKTFGIKHLKKYINEKIDEKFLFDEIIDTNDWFKHDLIKGLLGNAILYLGSSPGTDGERHYAIYLYKLMKKFKEEVKIDGKKIHPEIRAGNNFSLIVYSPFIKNKRLPEEDEKYMEKFGVKLYYVNNDSELYKILNEIQKN